MGRARALHSDFVDAAGRHPSRDAVREAGGASISYAALHRLSDRVRDRLVARGVRPGDRVGIWLPKTIDAVAAILGTLKAGAVYVPVDPLSPARRAGYILSDSGVRTVLADAKRLDLLAGEPDVTVPDGIAVVGPGGGEGLARALDTAGEAPATATVVPEPDALAYLLYTSGSTGTPKGVSVPHRAALAFTDWCATTFAPRAEDRFSSHAPFHFDLSILDLYVPLSVGACVVLIGEELGKDPRALAPTIASERLTVWYSTPSILSMLAQYGRLDRCDLSALRWVLFAGEVFPAPRLRALTRLVPGARYGNLYGPTETNVCTWHEVLLPVPEGRATPYPIGRACPHYESLVADEHGQAVAPGTPGELLIRGPGVMAGYWNRPEQDAGAFLTRGDERWYRTGDIVVDLGDGVLDYRGRRDRMVKRRGYRIELAEIETCLARHPAAHEAAVVAVAEAEPGSLRIVAFLGVGAAAPPSIIAMKQFCVEQLPAYMVPDAFRFLPSLPKTSTDKTDYQQLVREALERP